MPCIYLPSKGFGSENQHNEIFFSVTDFLCLHSMQFYFCKHQIFITVVYVNFFICYRFAIFAYSLLNFDYAVSKTDKNLMPIRRGDDKAFSCFSEV